MLSIVEELRTSRESGARRLESEYKAGLMTLARRLCADEGDAEELVNRTFADVVEGIDDYLEQSAFFGWMCKILENRFAKDMRRKSNRTVVADGDAVDDAMDENGADRIFQGVDAAILRDAIAGLPDEMKEALMLRYFMDLPVSRVAKILSVPEGTAKWRLHCARMILAAKLGAAAKKPGAKALLIVLAVAALTAIGAAVGVATRNTPPVPSGGTPLMEGGGEEVAEDTSITEEGGDLALSFVNHDKVNGSQTFANDNCQQLTQTALSVPTLFTLIPQGETMNTTTTSRVASMMAAAAVATSAALPRATSAETYVADVDTVETDSTQAFDTGVAVDGALKVEMDLQWMEIPSGDSMLFGASDGSKRCFLAVYGGHYYIGYGSETIHIQNRTVCPAVGDRHTVTCVFESGHLSFATNGVELCSESKSIATVNNTLAMLAYKMASEIKYRSSVRLYSAKIWKKSAGEWNLVRDYRPVLAMQPDGVSCVGALMDNTQGVVASTNIAFTAENIASNAAARAVMESVAGEPDELLNWVETDGRQFIDTEVTGGAAFSFSADFAWKDLGAGSNEEYTFLGASSGYGAFQAVHVVSKSAGGQLWVGYGSQSAYPADSSNNKLVMPLYARKTVSGTLAAGSQTLSCDGTTYTQSSPHSSNVNSKFAPLYIFALDTDGSVFGSRTRRFASVRFHSLSIGLGGTEVRHFLPCLKDGEAALYDSVNHRIYRSPVPFSAYGKLSDEPQTYVEYVETSGAQFVDTGVIGKSGTKFMADFCFLGSGSQSERTLLGSQDGTSDPVSRFVMFGGTFYSTRTETYYCYASSYRYPSFWTSDANELHEHVQLVSGDRHRLVADFRAGSQSLEIDGSCYYYDSGLVPLSGTGTRDIHAWDNTMADNVDTGVSMYLFARHMVTDTADKATQMTPVRLYKAKIWQLDGGGNYRLVRDYRPVKLKSGEVVLWDECSQTWQSVCWSATGAETTPFRAATVLSIR